MFHVNGQNLPFKFEYGEHEPSAGRYSQIDARKFFLHVIDYCAPKAVQALQEEPYHLYLKTSFRIDLTSYHSSKHLSKQIVAMTLDGKDRRGVPQWSEVELEPSSWSFDYDENLIKLRESLFQWSKNQHLDAMWCRAFAYQTLDYWSRLPERCNDVSWYSATNGTPSCLFRPLPYEEAASKEQRTLTFVRELEDYSRTKRAQIRAGAVKAFEQYLDSHLDQMEATANKRGFAATLKKREPLHFEWFVNFQVNGMSYEDVFALHFPNLHASLKQQGKLSSDNTKAIRKAINEISRIIELPLRPEGKAPGRRPTSRP